MPDINWKIFRSSLDANELKKFNFLCSRIKHWKQIIEVTESFRPLFKGSQVECEKHWMSDCYECNPIKSLDLILKKARKGLNGCRFLLRKLLVEHGLIEVPMIQPRIENHLLWTLDQRHPIERVFALSKNSLQRYTGKDALDNMRLIEAWMKERGI